MRFELLAMAAAALALAACAENEAATQKNFIEPPASSDRAVMDAAQKAVDSQKVFWTKFDGQEPGVSNYAVKIGMTAPDGYREMIWAAPIRREGGQVVARLLNDPIHLPGLKLGSEVRVPEGLVLDWTYTKGGKAYGHFTTRALAKHATPEQRAEAEAMLAPTPLEPAGQ